MLENFWLFCFLLAIVPGDSRLQPGLLREYGNVFNNLSNLALLPHLMETPECIRDCQIYQQAFLQNQMWAAKMFDTNGRLPAGILKGNMHQLGDLKQCVSTSSESANIEGKFCFIKIYIKPMENNTFMKEIWKNAYTVIMFTSKPYEKNVAPFNDVILSTFCVPSSCTARELMVASRKALSIFNHSTFGLEVHVDDLSEEHCVIKEEYYRNKIPLEYSAKIFIVFMTIFVCCVTVIDVFFLQNVQMNGNSTFCKSFSLQQNWNSLTKVENDCDSVGCLNGIRCIIYYLVFMLHFSVKFLIFSVDQSDVTQLLRYPILTSLVKNAPFVLDALIFSSGICLSHKIAKFSTENNTRAIWKLMFFKYIRFLMFWVVFLSIRSTAVSKSKVFLLYTPKTRNPNIWSIIFCYENFYGLANMYFAPAHTFYTDTQLAFIGCLTLILARRCENKMKIFFSIAFGSLIFRSLFLYFYSEIPPYMIFGLSSNHFLNMMSFMYGTPFSRLPFYMSGMALGYYTGKNPNQNPAISSFYQKIGWYPVLFCVCIVLYSHCENIDLQYEYNSFDGAVVSFINSLFSMIFLIWVVWYCEMFKKSSKVYRFLADPKFVILNRLTPYFSALHLFVLYVCIVESKFSFEFKLNEVLGLDYLLLTILVCGYIVLFIDLPLKNMWKYLTKKDVALTRSKCE
ncbi:uncharacterized protein LOC135840173 isoform X2 [Planococcus citri]|uniref:uncharacterized protein LOC135840173 isoform X2 n=1 Tax=Planococcus citri TaxID=170843 RepID=UPI0031F732F5